MRSAEELWVEYIDGTTCRNNFLAIIKADRAEVRTDAVQRCVDAAISWHRAGCSRVPSGLTDAIRAVATPPESPRERLGRVLYERMGGDAWEDFMSQQRYIDLAAAVIAEQARMEEEGKG